MPRPELLETFPNPHPGREYERAVNVILDDLVRSAMPRRMEVVGDFNVRGGIKSTITARHGASGVPTIN